MVSREWGAATDRRRFAVELIAKRRRVDLGAAAALVRRARAWALDDASRDLVAGALEVAAARRLSAALDLLRLLAMAVRRLRNRPDLAHAPQPRRRRLLAPD